MKDPTPEQAVKLALAGLVALGSSIQHGGDSSKVIADYSVDVANRIYDRLMGNANGPDA